MFGISGGIHVMPEPKLEVIGVNSVPTIHVDSSLPKVVAGWELQRGIYLAAHQ